MGVGQELGVEPDRVAHALEHDALEVVVQKGPRQSAKCSECLDVTAQEAVHLGVEAKAQEHAPRVAQYGHEAHQRSPRAADLQVTEVSPVDLHLFARQRAQAQVGLGRRARSHRAHQVAEVAALAGVAALAHHVVEPAGGQRRVLLQGLADEGPVRLDEARAKRDARRRGAMLAQDAAHRIAVHVQLARDGSHAPVLDGVHALDACGQLKRDGHEGCAAGRCSCAADPGAHGAAARGRSAGTPVPPMGALWPSPPRPPQSIR